LAGRETSLSRWEHLRELLLLRLTGRGILGFAWFRKTLTANRLVAIADKDLFEIINSEEGEGSSIVSMEEVASVFLICCGIRLNQRDLTLLSDVFAIGKRYSGGSGSDCFVDADRLADALRGEISPGRRRYLARLYAHLQREESVSAKGSITVAWIEERLCREIPPEVPVQRKFEHLTNDGARAHDVLATLPVVRAQVGLTCSAFVRWVSDLCFREPSHGAFVARVHRMWGACPEMADEREAKSWDFRIPGIA
jgi:hypothetical protein